MTLQRLAWERPRPRRNKYKGGFPLGAEIGILREIGLDPRKHPEQNAQILHPFGGCAEFGIRCDLKSEVKPDLICDAHRLPFADDSFPVVFLDPPYDDDYAKRLYGTPKLRYADFVKEAVRVCKRGGIIIIYHIKKKPRPKGTGNEMRILIETRVGQHVRWVGVFRKDGGRERE
jgi:16S rRNA G966 N2-methylase RsmD